MVSIIMAREELFLVDLLVDILDRLPALLEVKLKPEPGDQANEKEPVFSALFSSMRLNICIYILPSWGQGY
jgi:hypothetical protein